MKFRTLITSTLFIAAFGAQADTAQPQHTGYVRHEATEQSQKDFAADRFGIFLHWGIYSMFGQGEWYLNYGPQQEEYSKAAAGFYPANFNAGEWADAIKDSGARYICFTSRHHDGFSMFGTRQSDYNIVDATPFGRDVLRELADSVADRGLALHLYYSHIDWGRPDYPHGRTGRETGVDLTQPDWQGYYGFMNRQLTELLTNYGPIRCIWFDGWWDHDEDSAPFDWQLDEQYALIHRLQPSCLVANNHHQAPFEGEDIQIFERDLPGENTAGYSGQAISRLPLETCNTMNGMWGYKVVDTNYKSVPELVRYIVRAAGLGVNLLLNIGPQPDGSLPAAALDRLRGVGEWMRANGETIYGTEGAPFEAQQWGTATVNGDKMYVHVLDTQAAENGKIVLPWSGRKVRGAVNRTDGSKVSVAQNNSNITLTLPASTDDVDHIIELSLK